MSKNISVLMLFDYQVSRPRGYDYAEDFKAEDCKVYREVYNVLKKKYKDLRLLSLYKDIRPLIDEITEKKPDIVFNLADVFGDKSHFDKNIAWMLEIMGVIYTGGTPANLLICNNKALCKKILTYHRIHTPRFFTFSRGHRIARPKTRLNLPLIVKPLSEEASRGISQASLIENDEALLERVKFIHENMGIDAIAEEYIDGREFYVSILGSRRLKVFPIREIKFGEMANEDYRIATYKAKWDNTYREKWGIKNVFAGKLPEKWEERIIETCKRAYRALGLKCYARFDVRVDATGKVYVLEGNVNPSLEPGDEFEMSADKAGMPFKTLIEKIIQLAFTKDR